MPQAAAIWHFFACTRVALAEKDAMEMHCDAEAAVGLKEVAGVARASHNPYDGACRHRLSPIVRQ
jgi:hypothetical protein